MSRTNKWLRRVRSDHECGGQRQPAVVFADTGSPEGLGLVVNALTTAQEFSEAGNGVVVVFDGAGDVLAGACSYYAKAYGVKDAVEDAGVELLEDYKGHPSLHRLVTEGYEIVTF